MTIYRCTELGRTGFETINYGRMRRCCDSERGPARVTLTLYAAHLESLGTQPSGGATYSLKLLIVARDSGSCRVAL